MLAPRTLLCYRLYAHCPLDEEVIWAWVQSVGGHISIRADSIDFWIPAEQQLLLVCAWPELVRQPALDYI